MQVRRACRFGSPHRIRRVRRLQGGVLRSLASTRPARDLARPGDGGIGGPEPRPDSTAALKRDAADAATDYRKPGRLGRR